MRRYFQTVLGGFAHLGTAEYDDDTAVWHPPAQTLCGLDAPSWSKQMVRPRSWLKRRIGTVCMECDRTAMWESIISLDIQ